MSQSQTNAEATLIGRETDEGSKDALCISSGDDGSLVGDRYGVSAIGTAMTAHQHSTTRSVLVSIVKQTVQQVLQ